MTTAIRLLTTDELSELTRTPIDTLYYWRSKGIGPRGIKVGKRVLYRESDVVAWLDEQANAAA